MAIRILAWRSLRLGVLLVLALPAAAWAGTCVTIDLNTDGLPEAERKSALSVLAGIIEQEGRGPIVTDQCTETWAINHAKLGKSVTATLKGMNAMRQGTVSRVDDLPNLYSQMVKSLISGKPMDALGDNVTRDNVTTRQANPLRVEADSLFYMNLGYGLITGPAVVGGPGFGIGYRYELDAFALDASANLILGTKDQAKKDDALSGSWLRLQGLYYFSPMENRSAYLGGGASWGAVSNTHSGRKYTGSGLQGELTAGYEFFRATTVRLFAQFNATLPFYMAEGSATYVYAGLQPASSSETRYLPTFLVSVGVAFGRNNAIAVRQL